MLDVMMTLCHIRPMKTLLMKLVTMSKLLASFLPSRIPVGMNEFNMWADSIISLYGFPDNDSTRWTLAIMILHMDKSKGAYVPKRYFAIQVYRAMSNQVVSQAIQDLKEKQKALAEAAVVVPNETNQ